MASTYELRCRYHWQRKQVEVFIEGCEGVWPPLVIKPPFPTPKDLLTNALQYAVLGEVKNPNMSQKTFYKEGLFKMQYYNARGAYEQAKKPAPSWPLPTDLKSTKGHTCELKRGTEYCGGPTAVPDVIGTYSSWKTWTWNFDEDRLQSPARSGFFWEPLKVTTAYCHQCPAPPCTLCTCGIYGGTEAQATTYGQILGKIKQWGRFVQATQGVKSQFAYPEVFLLKASQIEMVDKLKQYGVPIQISTYVTIWDPAEEGFTNDAFPTIENDNDDNSDEDYDRRKGI